MPTSDQLMTLLMMRKRKGNVFSGMPRPILLQLIGSYYRSSLEELKTFACLPIYNIPYDIDESDPKVQEAIKQNEIAVQNILKPILKEHPASEISLLLHYVAFGNTTKVREMLDKNPELLVKTGDVMLPSGDTVLCVAPYECLLGAGDHYQDMHDIFNAAFKNIKDGEAEKTRQYERYKPYIEKIYQDGEFKQKAYDFQWIIDVIKERPLEEIQKALDKQFELDRPLEKRSKLNQALAKFRQDFAPRTIKSPCLHFNYHNLFTILKLFDYEWNALVVKKGNDDCYDKCRLVARQLVGFVMRGFSACELQGYAESLDDVVDNKSTHLKRTFKFKNDDGAVPIVAGSGSYSGLGFDFCLSIYGHAGQSAWAMWDVFGKLMSIKSIRLAYLMQRHQHEKSRCVIC